MTIKVTYLNGCWEYIHFVKSISSNGHEFIIKFGNDKTLKLDGKLKLEVSSR